MTAPQAPAQQGKKRRNVSPVQQIKARKTIADLRERPQNMKSTNPAVFEKSQLKNKTSIRILELWPNPDITKMVEGSLVIWDTDEVEQHFQDENMEEPRTPGTDDSVDDQDEQFENVGYEAVSYAWGTGHPTSEIRVFVDNQHFPFPVTKNLESALKHFRERRNDGENRCLWIDALCINQADYEERNSQVALMATIYMKASNVCVWLGEATENTSLAFRLINRIVDLSDFDELIQDQDEIKLLDEFSKLMSRDWFGRRWIVQEIALARNATIHCGDHFEQWDKFANAVSLFQKAELTTQSISKLFRSSKEHNFGTDVLGDVRFIGASRLVTAISRLFRKAGSGQILEHLLPLETLVAELTTFQAGDRRDIIYSVLSLAKDAQSSNHAQASEEAENYRKQFEKLSESAQQNVLLLSKISQRRLFTVDYKKSFFEVCKDFLEFAITGSRNLDIICRPWAPQEAGHSYKDKDKDSLPSWIPTLVNAAFGERPDGKYIRVHADPLVGDLSSAGKNYNASMNTKAYHVEFGQGLRSRSLFVNGVKIDEIRKLQGEALGGNISNAWLRFGGWRDRTADPPEPFWRTLVADRGPNGQNPPIYYKLACRYAFHQGPREAALNPEQIIRSGICSIGEEYLRRMQEVVWNKRLMRTRDFDRLGLAPGSAKEGDWICILFGCSVPVILRPVSEVAKTTNIFKLIGECYMHGMMDGEIFNLKLNQRKKERFELI